MKNCIILNLDEYDKHQGIIKVSSVERIVHLASFFVYAQKRKYITIAVDFDGTIKKEDKGWQGIGVYEEPLENASKYIKKLKELGCIIIIYTCRDEPDQITQYLNDNDIPFDYINENPDQMDEMSDKLVADAYIDNRGIRFLTWEQAFNDTFHYVIKPHDEIIKKQ